MQLQTRQIGIFAALAAFMAATRFYSHFGSAISLPDASLPVFFLAGFYLARLAMPAAAAFVVLLLIAGGVDYYAINFQGVSDWCFSPAYWFLIPTYACMWYAGRWFAARQQASWHSLGMLAATAWVSTTAAFLISNGSFFLLSGRFSDMSLAHYAGSVAKYYPLYLTSTLIYLAFAAALHAVLATRAPTAANAADE